MSIENISRVTPPVVPLVNTQKQVKGDSDGDNDNSRPGEVEKAEQKSPVTTTLGNSINTTA